MNWLSLELSGSLTLDAKLYPQNSTRLITDYLVQ
jgi:hypothetical protein